jgi:hypothetical protein
MLSTRVTSRESKPPIHYAQLVVYAGGYGKPICRRTSPMACMIVYVSSSRVSGLSGSPARRQRPASALSG